MALTGPGTSERIAKIAERGIKNPRSLSADEITALCIALLDQYSRTKRAGVFYILVKKAVVDEIPAVDRKDALRGWLAKCCYETLSEAAKERQCDVSEIVVMDKPGSDR